MENSHPNGITSFAYQANFVERRRRWGWFNTYTRVCTAAYIYIYQRQHAIKADKENQTKKILTQNFDKLAI